MLRVTKDGVSVVSFNGECADRIIADLAKNTLEVLADPTVGSEDGPAFPSIYTQALAKLLRRAFPADAAARLRELREWARICVHFARGISAANILRPTAEERTRATTELQTYAILRAMHYYLRFYDYTLVQTFGQLMAITPSARVVSAETMERFVGETKTGSSRHTPSQGGNVPDALKGDAEQLAAYHAQRAADRTPPVEYLYHHAAMRVFALGGTELLVSSLQTLVERGECVEWANYRAVAYAVFFLLRLNARCRAAVLRKRRPGHGAALLRAVAEFYAPVEAAAGRDLPPHLAYAHERNLRRARYHAAMVASPDRRAWAYARASGVATSAAGTVEVSHLRWTNNTLADCVAARRRLRLVPAAAPPPAGGTASSGTA